VNGIEKYARAISASDARCSESSATYSHSLNLERDRSFVGVTQRLAKERRQMKDDLKDTAHEREEPFDGLTEENPSRKPVTREMIAERAYLISQSDDAGTDEENWLRAERELQEEQER